ncbi:hypothetical protein O7621_19105 [Solwaraspora sp. WMMD937]|uniref:hypothetical protein n=1 Tax=Solwaraspora sp. WMMD937 TaxID=3016090 RepID=UPI00249A52D2|nr:hypothetical protein [Solwaraspora sp. WMMD937]WFE20017.1 hypothetical protein O7621_19105 [Solwaraspora sp. WMMD937]
MALLTAGGLTFISAPPARAFGGETFGCRVAPGTDLVWRSICYNNQPAGTYNAGFAVRNTSGTGYTYSWSISGSYLYVITGCTTTSSDCALAMPNADGAVQVTVTYTQAGQSATSSTTAVIRQFCGTYLC